MAGPVPPYLTTQTAAQTAFTVPFGLLALVNGAITTATVAGQFNTTVDCSLFTATDISNLRIYLDSLGYTVDFAANTSERGLLIDWGKPLDIDGSGGGSTTVIQGTIPWIVAEAPSPTGVTLFATSDTVPSGIETTLLSYTVPVASFNIRQLVAWGTYDGEFLLRKNGTIVGGGRTSAADRTLNITYEAGQIPTVNGDTITVTILYYNVNTSGVHQFRCNLIGE